MKENCPPIIKLEAYFLEGADSKTFETLKPHINACTDCEDVLRDLETERDAFLQRYPFSRFSAESDAKRRPLWKRALEWLPAPRTFGASLALTGLAGVLVLTLWQKQPAEPTILVKGGVGLSFYAATGTNAKVEAGKDGMTLPEGSQIQFVYSNENNPYLLLVGVEEDGTITAYFPADASAPTAESATASTGSRVKLSQGLRWEPKSASERFYAVFSQQPVLIDEIRKAVAEVSARGKTVEQTPKLPLPYPQASILLHRKNGK